MAEAVVAFLLAKLSELITREASLVLGVEDEITSLRNELEWIRSFLKDADGKRKTSERASVWVNQVRDVAYDAEDVLDHFLLKAEHQRRRQQSVGGVVRSLRSCVGGTNQVIQLKTLHEVANQIEKIKRRIEEISANKSKYGIEALQLGGEDESSSSTKSSDQKMVVAPESEVVGIEEDANMLVNQLVAGRERRFSVVSIVGMGGLGKTTLAKKVYNDSDVIRHFDCRAWISISQEYRQRNVLEAIIHQFTRLEEEVKEEIGKMSDEELGKELFGYLKQRRYLVVVDDIWSIEAWDNLEAVFPAEETNGSRVMLTTRNKEVALYADVDSIPHELRFLTEDECWELFCRRVFSKRDMSCMSTELEKVGREIVAKCRGLPLAVVVLAGILSRKKLIPNEWAKVLKNINQESDERHNQIFRILSLSYEYLPYHLKSCFLYFAVFPEDFEIPARKLIRFWVAEGLARQRGSETEEEMAENHLKELIDRSMVQASKRRYNGEIRTCRIHDLLRDLAISEAKEDKFLDVQSDLNSASPSTARRLTIHGSIAKYINLNIPTPHLRSLWRFPSSQINFEALHKKDLFFLCRDFRLLRVLDLSEVLINRLPKEVGEMIHLRYLGLEGGSIRRLPSTLCNIICNLSRLHTLIIKPFVPGTQLLPITINKMDQLRHLVMNWGKLNERSRVDGLTNLQTLSMVLAGPWIKNGLDKLTSLRRLGIRDVLSCHKEALSESIVKLNCLQSLVLSADEGNMLPTLILTNHAHLYKLRLHGRLEKLPDLVEFPPNLLQLTLVGTHLMEDPMATLEKLPLLRTLYLGGAGFLEEAAYVGKGMVCSAGGFPQLEKLELYGQDELEEWKLEEGAMLNLRRLYIQSCCKLKMLPEGLQHITTLQKLKLRSMSDELKSRIHPLKDGPEWHKIQHVPSLFIDGDRQ